MMGENLELRMVRGHHYGGLSFEQAFQNGLTQSRAGELVGVDGVTVRRWELGIFSPSGENLQHLAEIYGLTIEDLLSAATLDNGHKPST